MAKIELSLEKSTKNNFILDLQTKLYWNDCSVAMEDLLFSEQHIKSCIPIKLGAKLVVTGGDGKHEL